MKKAKVQVIQSWSQNIFGEGWYQSCFFQKRKQNRLSVAESQLTIQATELEPQACVVVHELGKVGGTIQN